MDTPGQLVSDWLPEESAIEIVDHLQQEILQTPSETRDPCEALARAYEKLTNEQKIAFILAGGAEHLFQYQEQYIQQMRTGRCSSDTKTGQLPIICWGI
jgi:hypothetical protein